MKELLFNLGGCPVRVYLTDVDGVYLNALDVAAALKPKMKTEEFLKEYPPYPDVAFRSPCVYTEDDFFRILRQVDEDSDHAPFLTDYLHDAIPDIRMQIAMIAEARWQKDDQIRQLTEDMEMNLAERRKAEKRLADQSREFSACLKRFTVVCAENGVLSRLLLEIRRGSRSKALRARITEVLKTASALYPDDKREAAQR